MRPDPAGISRGPAGRTVIALTALNCANLAGSRARGQSPLASGWLLPQALDDLSSRHRPSAGLGRERWTPRVADWLLLTVS